MKQLEQLLIRARAAGRSARSLLPGGSAATLPPARLVLRLNDVRLAPGLVRATGEPLTPAEWRTAIARFVEWLGPLRVTFSGGEPARSHLLEDLVRFANRLECPTHLITAGPVDTDLAESLVDRGLSAATVLVGGVDDGTHRAAVGSELAWATGALEALKDARQRRGRRLGLYVGMPLVPSNLRAAGAVAGWARQAGADGVLATVPLGFDPPEGGLAAVDALGRDNLTPNHLKLWLVGKRHRRHGGLRAEVLSDGTLVVSPCVAPLGEVRTEHPQTLWAAADEAIREVRRHPRPWDEIELVPRWLASTR